MTIFEQGHFLGLYHTFDGDSCDPSNENDLVNDTAQHLERSESTCRTLLRDTCPFLTGQDPVFNYMSTYIKPKWIIIWSVSDIHVVNHI